MSPTRQSRLRGFTLVEMLVVLAIIGVLVALLLPAVMMAMNAARRAAIATDIRMLSDAVESYKNKMGDYPPNFRQYDVVMRHVRKCYPDATPQHRDLFIKAVWGPAFSEASPPLPAAAVVPMIDEGEALVFWLHLIDADKREPFKAAIAAATAGNPLLAATSPVRYGTIDEQKLFDGGDADTLPSFRAVNAGETCYVYVDSRSYNYFYQPALFTDPLYAAHAEDPTLGYTRPYWSEIRSTTGATSSPLAAHYKPMAPTTFQIICAGQDGEFGLDPATLDAKFFPQGGNYSPADRDNMTSFSEGRRLQDFIE
jgi:prepilin-type N-terminal cleavage/methylation domain-containing protein